MLDRDLSRNTVTTILGVLRAMRTSAVDDEVIAVNPAVGFVGKLKLGRSQEDEEEIKPFTAEQPRDSSRRRPRMTRGITRCFR
jgi:hypothetical protein